jgi:phosphohistidine swiveling domain-containing protein
MPVKIKKSDYHFFGLWKADLLEAYFWLKWHQPDLLKKLGMSVSEGGILDFNGGYFFTKQTVLDQIDKDIGNLLAKEDTDFFEKLITISEDIYQVSLAKADNLANQEVTPVSVKEFMDAACDVHFAWCFGFLLSNTMEPYLLKQAEIDGVNQVDIAGLVPTVTTPLIKQREEIKEFHEMLKAKGLVETIKSDIKQAVVEIKKDEDLHQKLGRHVEEYGWIELLNLIGEDLTLERLLEQISDYVAAEEYRAPKYQLSEHFEYLLNMAAKVSYLRQVSAEYFSMYTLKTRPFLHKLSKRLGVTYRGMLSLAPCEIISITEGKHDDAQEIVKRRRNYNWGIYLDDQGQLQIVDDKAELDKWADELIQTSSSDTSVIKGQTGNKGKARGKVKVILNTDDFHKMKEGDVLVTTMTTPDFVVLMQKSCAIVTDIGGLLSHAAIISREMGKPCIIGTGSATKTFIDGDQVEVNANEGIVKKLS